MSTPNTEALTAAYLRHFSDEALAAAHGLLKPQPWWVVAVEGASIHNAGAAVASVQWPLLVSVTDPDTDRHVWMGRFAPDQAAVAADASPSTQLRLTSIEAESTTSLFSVVAATATSDPRPLRWTVWSPAPGAEADAAPQRAYDPLQGTWTQLGAAGGIPYCAVAEHVQPVPPPPADATDQGLVTAWLGAVRLQAPAGAVGRKGAAALALRVRRLLPPSVARGLARRAGDGGAHDGGVSAAVDRVVVASVVSTVELQSPHDVVRAGGKPPRLLVHAAAAADAVAPAAFAAAAATCARGGGGIWPSDACFTLGVGDPEMAVSMPFRLSHTSVSGGGGSTSVGEMDLGPIIRGRLYTRGMDGKGHVTVVPVGNALCLLVLRGGVLFPSTSSAATSNVACGARHHDPAVVTEGHPITAPATAGVVAGAADASGSVPPPAMELAADATYSPTESRGAPDEEPPAAPAEAHATALSSTKAASGMCALDEAPPAGIGGGPASGRATRTHRRAATRCARGHQPAALTTSWSGGGGAVCFTHVCR